MSTGNVADMGLNVRLGKYSSRYFGERMFLPKCFNDHDSHLWLDSVEILGSVTGSPHSRGPSVTPSTPWQSMNRLAIQSLASPYSAGNSLVSIGMLFLPLCYFWGGVFLHHVARVRRLSLGVVGCASSNLSFPWRFAR